MTFSNQRIVEYGDEGGEPASDDDDDESFHYPGSGTPTIGPSTPVLTRPASIRSYHTDYFSLGLSSSSRPADLTPTLAQATEFRVPTNEAPQKVTTPRANAPTPHAMHSQWERDTLAVDCRGCKKRFTFYFRKVSMIFVPFRNKVDLVIDISFTLVARK